MIHSPLASLILAVGVATNAACAEAGWKAGAGRVRITPERPLWMSGYASRDRPAEGTRIDLWAKAVTLEDAREQRATVVGLDLVGIDRRTAESIRREASKRYGLRPEAIWLTCSHTHTGPVVGRNLETMYFLTAAQTAAVTDYTDWLEKQVVAAIGDSVAALKPATVRWGEGRETFAVNRRNNVEPQVPALRAAGKLNGPVDYSVPVLRIDGEKGLLAVLFGYACHATVLSDYQWSGDYPGYAQRSIEKLHPDATAVFVAGCGADQNPLPRRTPELAESYGERLAACVEGVLGSVLLEIKPRLETEWSEVRLPLETLPTRSDFEAESKLADRFRSARARKFLGRMDRGEPIERDYPFPAGVWRLGGELLWVALGGEVVVDYALRLKRHLPGRLWVSAYAHDVMAYLPSARVWDEGGYEGATSMIYYGFPARWSREAEERVVAEVFRQARSLGVEATP